MAPVLGFVERNNHEMGHADTDVLEAPGTEVRLARLEGMNECDFELVVGVGQPRRAQSTNRITTTNAASTSA